MTPRQAEKKRLIEQRAALEAKYPPSVYDLLIEEPDDILRHTREVIRYNAVSHAEHFEIAWRRA